jgi:hypothetical protein
MREWGSEAMVWIEALGNFWRTTQNTNPKFAFDNRLVVQNRKLVLFPF